MPVFRKDNKNILFIHVPKAGGTSIERLLGRSGFKIEYHDPHVDPTSMNALRQCSPQHMHREMLDLVLRLDRFDLIFMVVRHPMARFKSELAMQDPEILNASQSEIDDRAMSAMDTFELNHFAYDNHLRPQHQFEVDGCVVYRLEEGLDVIRKDVGRRINIRLPHEIPWARRRRDINGASSGEITFGVEVEGRIRRLYAEDFASFSYE